MNRLTLLGRLSIESSTASPGGAASRPRPLALLALLAAAGQAGLPRDRCLLFLWPESDTRRGRNSLHQTLHSIRGDLGQDAVLAAANVVLNPRAFTVDLWEFNDAVANGDFERAIALHAGPFLDGFTLPGLPELEQWIEQERSRVTRRYLTALESTARAFSAEADHSHAIARWRAAVEIDPFSTRLTLGLMRALAAAGDRASALEFARSYDTLVRRELGTEPDDAITALVRELRANMTPPAAVHAATRDSSREQETATLDDNTPTAARDRPAEQRDASDVDSSTPSVPADEALKAGPAPVRGGPGGSGRRGRSRRTIVAVVVACVALAVAGIWWVRQRVLARQSVSDDLVAVFPFTLAGSGASEYLRSGLVDLLTTNIDGAGSLRSVDPEALLGWLNARRHATTSLPDAEATARRFGAGRYILGSVSESGTRLRIRASLYDHEHRDAPLAQAAVEGEGTELFALVDQLTAQLLAGASSEPRDRLVKVAAATTTSLEALKSYLNGEQELRAGRFARAADAYQLAVARDSTFALAFYRLSVAAEWLARDSLARWASARALRFAARLPEHDATLVQALAAVREGRIGDAEHLYRDVVDDYPDDVEAWLRLGEVLFHGNPLRGQSATESRTAFQRVLQLDPGHEEALLHLARLDAIDGDDELADSLVARAGLLAPDHDVFELRAFRAFALGDRDAWKRTTRELQQGAPDIPPAAALRAAVHLDDVQGLEAFGNLLRDRRFSGTVRGFALRLLARTAAADGRWDLARARLDSADRFDRVATLELRSLLVSLPFLQAPVADVEAVRKEVEQWQPGRDSAVDASHSSAHAGLHPWIREYRLGLLSLRLGDTADATKRARALAAVAPSTSSRELVVRRTFAQSLRARIELAGNRPAEALAQLAQADWVVIESSFEAEAADRLLRAELLARLGRDDEALGWYRAMAQRAAYELVYLAPARWQAAAIEERRGDREGAGADYALVARLWRDASGPLRQTATDAAERWRELTEPGPIDTQPADSSR